MNEWEYTLGKTMSHDECYFVGQYPGHIARAFLAVWDDEDEEASGIKDASSSRHYAHEVRAAIQRFAQRWGGLETAAFLSALREARGSDRLVAMFALGHNPEVIQALDLLAPFLTSADQLERCAAACMLALRRDERALPVLEEYLLQDLSDDEQGHYRSTSDAMIWYANYQSRIARLLANWGPPTVVPVLRQALLHRWEIEVAEGDGGNVYDQSTQDALCYALGSRGALGAVHGIALSAQRRRIALIYLASGYVRADERFDRFLGEALLLDRELKREVTAVLVAQFALSEKESWETLRTFHWDAQKRRDKACGLEEWDDTLVRQMQMAQTKETSEIGEGPFPSEDRG